MELQIQDLVSSIRKDGIDAANEQASAIISDAQARADKIVADAKAEAGRIMESSEKQIAVLRESAVVSAEQAKRDAVLSFRSEIQCEFEKLLAAKVKNSLSDEALGRLISAALADKDVGSYTAEVAEVSDALRAELAEEIRNGLEIRPTKGVRAGFRLAAKDGSGYFDCTDGEITQMLMPYFRDIRPGE